MPPDDAALSPDPATLLRGGVRVDVSGPVLTVTLARPEVRNAQTPATWRALAAIGTTLPPDVRVVVLRGEGASFSAGLDRAMLSPDGIPGEVSVAELVAGGTARVDEAIAAYQEAFTWWRRPEILSLAVVQGHAVGAGFQLALACDLRVLADDARLAMRETSLGLVPDLGGTKPLVELVGYARALEICATGRWVDASEALTLGLATAVSPSAELDATVARLLAALLVPEHAAVTALKGLLSGAPARSYEDQRAAERLAQAGRLRALVEESQGLGRESQSRSDDRS